MTNEAVCIEAPTKYARYSVYDVVGIAKGTLLMLSSADLYAIASSGAGSTMPKFAGIAVMEKVANDGSTEISAALDGTWDLTSQFDGSAAGALMMLSGANQIRSALAASLLSGAVVGRALENATEGTTNKVIRVRVGSII